MSIYTNLPWGLEIGTTLTPTFMAEGTHDGDGGLSTGITITPLFRGETFAVGPELGVSFSVMDDTFNRNVGWRAGIMFDFLKAIGTSSWGLRLASAYVGEYFLSDRPVEHGIDASLSVQFGSSDRTITYDRDEDDSPFLVGGFGPWLAYFPGTESEINRDGRIEAGVRGYVNFEI